MSTISIEAASEPFAVLTGDTLFVGDVGRPDLRASLGWSSTDLGALLYDSLQSKLLPLPDASLVYPAHGAGSLCGRSYQQGDGIDDRRSATLELRSAADEQKAFIELVTADQPEAPPYFTYDAVLNSKERPTLNEALERELKPLALDALLALQADGAQILDTREPEEFGAAHLTGSVNIGLGGQYATWAGTVLDHAHPIVIIAAPGREGESAIRLGRIGFDHIAGYLHNGLQSLESRPELVAFIERLSPQFVAELLASSEPPLAIDVRMPRERAQKHIGGSLSVPLNHLSEHLKTLPKNRPLLVYCAGGYRSSIAASMLQGSGFDRVGEIAGGIGSVGVR